MATLVIPTVSVGNIPQLAVDLLIHNLPQAHFDRDLNSKYLYPFVGARDYVTGPPSTGIATAIQLYKTGNTYIIQQRSPFIDGYENNFIVEVLKPLVEELGIQNIIILDSAEEVFDRMDYSKRFAVGSNISVEGLKIDDSSNTQVTGDFVFTEGKTEVHPESLATKVLFHLPLKTTIISIFAYEGDNSLDAVELATKFTSVVGTSVEEWRAPKSWEGVYGSKPIPDGFDQGIYV